MVGTGGGDRPLERNRERDRVSEFIVQSSELRAKRNRLRERDVVDR